MRSFRLIPLAAVGLAAATVGAGAETWPTKPIKAIVPIAAGSVLMWFPAWFSSSSPPSLGRRSSWKTAPVPANDGYQYCRQG